MNSIDKKSYNFKNNIINIFNNQEELPFLLKYYLIKQIWEQIDNHRKEIEIEYTQNDISQQTTSQIEPISDVQEKEQQS